MNHKIWFLLPAIFIIFVFVSATDFTPQGNINLRETYNITGKGNLSRTK